MNVAGQNKLNLSPGRPIPSTVQLDVQVISSLRAPFGGTGAPAPSDTSGPSGLLFGTVDHASVTIEACRPFPPGDATLLGSSEREDAAFKRCLAAANADRALRTLRLVGWYSVRAPDDIAPLLDSDLLFHNRQFQDIADIGLIVKPKQTGSASIEVYSRPSTASSLSRKDCRFGSFRFNGAAPLVGRASIILHEAADDDYHLRVFQVLDSLERAEKRATWRELKGRIRRVFPSRSKAEHPKPAALPERPSDRQDPPRPPLAAVRDKEIAAVPSSPPRKPPTEPRPAIPPVAPPRTKLRWAPPAALLVLAVAVALVFVYARPLLLEALPSKAPAPPPEVQGAASVHLNMRAEPQADGSLLVQWDAHSPALKSARNGSLEILDGSEHRDFALNSAQIADGSLLYTPRSPDLNFRLQIIDASGSPVSESVRIVNGSSSAWSALTPSKTRLGVSVTKHARRAAVAPDATH